MDLITKKIQGSNGIANALKKSGPITEYDFLFDSLGEAAQSKGVSLNDVKGTGVTLLNGLSKAVTGSSIDENKGIINVVKQDINKIASSVQDAQEKVNKVTIKFGSIILGGSPNNTQTNDTQQKKGTGFFTKLSSTALKNANKVAADKVKSNKNDAFKYGLGLIVCGAMYAALMFPNMKSQLSQLVESGKPVMEKVFAALKLLVNAAIAFVPMALGALLLWFSYSEASYDKDSAIDKIIYASITFFKAIETALFGEAKPEAAAEAPKTEETKAMIQQRIAMLQMDLAQIAHDLA